MVLDQLIVHDMKQLGLSNIASDCTEAALLVSYKGVDRGKGLRRLCIFPLGTGLDGSLSRDYMYTHHQA